MSIILLELLDCKADNSVIVRMARLVAILASVAYIASTFAGKELFLEANDWLQQPLIDLGFPYVAKITLLWMGLGASLIAGILQHRNLAIGSSVLYIGYVVFVDFNFLQPYNYIYLIFLILACERERSEARLFGLLTLFMAGVYIWSGFHKFNEIYADHAFYNTFSGWSITQNWSEDMWKNMAYVSGGIEMLVAIGLLFSRTRIVSAVVIVIMHLLVVWTLSPAGINWNPTVWPWNIFMAIVLLLIVRHQMSNKEEGNLVPKISALSKTGWVMIFLAWLLPITSEFGLIPSTLGWNLYTAKEPYGVVCLNERLVSRELTQSCLYDGGQVRFYVNLFFIYQTNTAITPTKANIENVYSSIQEKYPEMEGREMRFGRYYTHWNCE